MSVSVSLLIPTSLGGNRAHLMMNQYIQSIQAFHDDRQKLIRVTTFSTYGPNTIDISSLLATAPTAGNLPDSASRHGLRRLESATVGTVYILRDNTA